LNLKNYIIGRRNDDSYNHPLIKRYRETMHDDEETKCAHLYEVQESRKVLILQTRSHFGPDFHEMDPRHRRHREIELHCEKAPRRETDRHP